MIIVTGVFIVVFVLEAWMDLQIILNEERLRNIEYDPWESYQAQKRTDLWHKINVGIYVMLVGWGCWESSRNLEIVDTFYNILSISVIAWSLRIIIFNITLNLLRGLDWWHVGEKGLEQYFKGKIILGKFTVQKEILYYVMFSFIFLIDFLFWF